MIEPDAGLTRQRIKRTSLLLLGLVFGLSFVFPVLGGLVIGRNAARALALPNETKRRLMEHDSYRNSGITTIEKFDRCWSSLKPKPPFASVLFSAHFVVATVLSIGVLLFQRWALFAFVAYSVYCIAESAFWFLPGVEASRNLLMMKMARVVLFTACVVYFTRRPVRDSFAGASDTRVQPGADINDEGGDEGQE